MLNGCVKTNYNNVPTYNLPELPIAGEKVANELTQVCNDNNCNHLNIWLNDLYLFKQQYSLYRWAIINN